MCCRLLRAFINCLGWIPERQVSSMSTLWIQGCPASASTIFVDTADIWIFFTSINLVLPTTFGMAAKFLLVTTMRREAQTLGAQLASVHLLHTSITLFRSDTGSSSNISLSSSAGSPVQPSVSVALAMLRKIFNKPSFCKYLCKPAFKKCAKDLGSRTEEILNVWVPRYLLVYFRSRPPGGHQLPEFV